MTDAEGAEDDLVWDDEGRERILTETQKIDYAGEGAAQLSRLRAGATPFPPLPEELWGVVPLIVPGEPDREGDPCESVEVPSSRENVELWHDVLTPNLTQVSFSSLSAHQLVACWEYLVAYTTYVRYQRDMWQAELRTVKAQQEFLKAQLTLHYSHMTTESGKPLPSAVRTSYVRVDPALLKLEGRTGMLMTVVSSLGVLIKSLEDTMTMCSRFLTNQHVQIGVSGRAPGQVRPDAVAAMKRAW